MKRRTLTNNWRMLGVDSDYVMLQPSGLVTAYIGETPPSSDDPGFTLKHSVQEYNTEGLVLAVRGTGNVTYTESNEQVIENGILTEDGDYLLTENLNILRIE